LDPHIESAQSPTTVTDDASPSANLKSAKAAPRTSFLVYLIAIAFSLFSGWVNQVVDDALLTALCVLAFSMLMGTWKKDRPWRWVVLVWIGVPILLGYYQFVVGWRHDRGQVYGAFLQILAGSAGGFGGHFMREMIDHVFLKQDD
jgi:ABC-type multidrug transport system permease subunit